jgi:hypothetical protein
MIRMILAATAELGTGGGGGRSDGYAELRRLFSGRRPS